MKRNYQQQQKQTMSKIKSILFFLLLSFLSVACNPSNIESDNGRDSKIELIEDYLSSIQNEDLALHSSLFLIDPFKGILDKEFVFIQYSGGVAVPYMEQLLSYCETNTDCFVKNSQAAEKVLENLNGQGEEMMKVLKVSDLNNLDIELYTKKHLKNGNMDYVSLWILYFEQLKKLIITMKDMDPSQFYFVNTKDQDHLIYILEYEGKFYLGQCSNVIF